MRIFQRERPTKVEGNWRRWEWICERVCVEGFEGWRIELSTNHSIFEARIEGRSSTEARVNRIFIHHGEMCFKIFSYLYIIPTIRILEGILEVDFYFWRAVFSGNSSRVYGSIRLDRIYRNDTVRISNRIIG